MPGLTMRWTLDNTSAPGNGDTVGWDSGNTVNGDTVRWDSGSTRGRRSTTSGSVYMSSAWPIVILRHQQRRVQKIFSTPTLAHIP